MHVDLRDEVRKSFGGYFTLRDVKIKTDEVTLWLDPAESSKKNWQFNSSVTLSADEVVEIFQKVIVDWSDATEERRKRARRGPLKLR